MKKHHAIDLDQFDQLNFSFDPRVTNIAELVLDQKYGGVWL